MSAEVRVPSPSANFRIARQKAVSWFDTRQLLATGSQALAATIIGSMSGRREIMAALDPQVAGPFDLSEERDLWVDYIADTGDGWNATTSIAWLAGRDAMVLDPAGAPTEQPVPPDCFTEGSPTAPPGCLLLPAGELLVLGGDEVYPTASPETYQHRFIDPFRCARWYDRAERRLFSIPGNHDWYDGLTSFIRLFCQSEESRRWFGCWQAQQRRSYFSIKLPHRWWIWGIDMALEDDLDPPQYDYFRAQAAHLESGDKLILVVPAPTWIKNEAMSARSGSGRYIANDKLELITRLRRQEGREVEVPLVLTGDLHYYARHEAALDEGKRHYIVCGGGGAFGLGTLQVPETVVVPDADGTTRDGHLKKTFPDRRESLKQRRKVMGFPFKNPAFTIALTLLQAITLWLLSSAQSGWVDRLIVPGLGFDRLCVMIAEAASAALASPALLAWLLLLLFGFGAFAKSGSPPRQAAWKAWLWGIGHGVLQIVGTFVCIWLAAQAIGYLFYGSPEQWQALTKPIGLNDNWATLIVASGISYFYCGMVFALNLLLGHKLLCLHDQEVFSAQGIEGFKSFLKIRISPEGLHLYPIGLRRHVAEWKEAPGVEITTESSGIFSKVQVVSVPEGAQRVVDPCEPICPHLIEEPIFIPGAPRQ